MKVKLKFTRNKIEKTIKITKGDKIQDILNKEKLKPDTVIVMEKGRPIPIDEEINREKELTITQISSGG